MRLAQAGALVLAGMGFGIVWPAAARVRQIGDHLGWWSAAVAFAAPLLVAAGWASVPASRHGTLHRVRPLVVGAVAGGVSLIIGEMIARFFMLVVGGLPR